MLQLARQQDRDAINTLALQVHNLHVAWRPDLFVPVEELYTRERFEAEVKLRQLYAAVIDGTVVGYVRLQVYSQAAPGMVSRKIMTVEEFCVHESCRNQGIGKSMMVDVRALAAAFRCTDLQLGVYPQNDEAIGFYQKCGFTIRKIDMQQTV